MVINPLNELTHSSYNPRDGPEESTPTFTSEINIIGNRQRKPKFTLDFNIITIAAV